MLLEAINKQNNTALTWNQIASGYPEVIQSEGAERNTRVLLYGLNGQGYKGSVSIEYDRIDMPTLFRNLVPVIITNPKDKLSDLLPFLNEKYGLSLIADDIVDQSVKDLGDSWLLDVAIKPGCLAWQGGFTLRFAKFIPNLKDVVTDVDLSVIIAPYTVDVKPHAEYVAYGYDWSELSKSFVTDWAFNRVLTAADVDALNEVVPLKFAFVNGATAQPGQIALSGARFKGVTAVTPNSKYDEDFERVATIDLAADSNYSGSLILHFQPV
ncbi:putative virion structural protein [Erwinia phage vB_EamM_Stratton]|uniref:Putative virion structural protein n=1 Tax=Erwinia phage vB_EamM_Stratton TaxID=1883378 RepID=A0A1B2IH63_9CAUD|nr:putative virion structural protein [Erwinia phage vB_EamM_Stratton]